MPWDSDKTRKIFEVIAPGGIVERFASEKEASRFARHVVSRGDVPGACVWSATEYGSRGRHSEWKRGKCYYSRKRR